MDQFACNLIDALGGSTAVAKKMFAPVTTVQSWKDNGIPISRLAHLRLIADGEGVALNWETGCPLVSCNGDSADHAASDTVGVAKLSSGKNQEISAPQVAA